MFSFDLRDFTGYKRIIPYILIILWPLVVIWLAILIVYDATIGNYLWKKNHKKWLNEKNS